MTQYILADNQELTKFAIESLLQRRVLFPIKRATNKASLLQLLRENEDALVILDYTLFDFADEEQLFIVADRYQKSSWLLISDELTEKFVRKIVYSSKSFSIVFKDSTLESISLALQSAAAGKRYLCPRAEGLLLHHQEEDNPDKLTSTELEVVKAIALGKTTKEIAAERFSSVHTITTHRKNIFRKLRVNTVHEVIKYALRAGLVDTSEFYI